MEHWDNSYTSWNWYNEVLEHRNGGSMFEADEENKQEEPKTEETPTGNANGEPSGDTENPSGEGDGTGDAGGGENKQATDTPSEQKEREGENANPESKNSESEKSKWNEYLEKGYDDKIGTQAGKDLVDLRGFYSGKKFSAYNPWKMSWRTHPYNIATQLDYLFPESNGTWKIWNPKYKDMTNIRAGRSRNSSEQVRSEYFKNFTFIPDTLFRGDECHCSSRILLNDKDDPITKVFNLDKGELKEFADNADFKNAVNIDILGLACSNETKFKSLCEKMKESHGYEASDLNSESIKGAKVYPLALFRPLSNDVYAELKEKFGNERSSKEYEKSSDIKKSEQIKKVIDAIAKKSKTGLDKYETVEKDKMIYGIKLKEGEIKNTIESMLSDCDTFNVSTKFTAKGGFRVPVGMINSLYDIDRIVIQYSGNANEYCNITAVYRGKPGLKYKHVKSYTGDDTNIKEDTNTYLILVEAKNSIDGRDGIGSWVSGNNYGIEMSYHMASGIFIKDQPQNETEIIAMISGNMQESIGQPTATKPDYLSPLIGLDLSGIRREIMESSNLNGLLEASLNEFLPKRGRKAPKYIKHPYKGTNGSITYKGIKQKENGAARTMWLVPSDSDPSKTYTVQVDVEVPGKGGLFSIARKKNRKPGELVTDRNNLRTSNLRVYCSCPDFHWGGAEYNLGKKDSIIQNPETTDGNPGGRYKHTTKDGKSYVETYPTTVKPEKRDPLGVKDGCKHIYAVLLEFRRKIPTIFADAKKAPADLEKVGSFNENTGILVQTPEAQGIMNELADIALPDNAEQTQSEPIEQTEQVDQTENRGEDVEMAAEGEPEEYAAESEPEQSSEEDISEEMVPEEDNGVEKNKSLFDRIKDGLSSLKDKAGNALGRIFRHEDCELAGHLIELALESDDPRVIQDSVNKIAALLEANGKHEYAKSLLESSIEHRTKHTK